MGSIAAKYDWDADRFPALVRDLGRVPWDPEAPRLLSERTGLSHAASTQVLIGRGEWYGWDSRFDARERPALGVTAAESKDAQRELSEIYDRDKLTATALFERSLPQDPAELWQPGGIHALTERLAAYWVEQFGRRPNVPPATLAAAVLVEMELNDSQLVFRPSAAVLCATLADPDGSAMLTAQLDSRLEKSTLTTGFNIIGESDALWPFGQRWEPLIQFCRWAYAYLPASDPVRDGVPRTIELLRAQLRQPGLLLSLGTVSAQTITALHTRRESEPWPKSPDADTFDDGLIVAKRRRSDEWELYFRPASFQRDDRSADLRAVVRDYRRAALLLLDWVFGPEVDAMRASIDSGRTPAGRFETDPTLSVPDLVDTIATELGVHPDAAALYLQLAALPAPTDRSIRMWNGWKPARHRAAESALVDKGLVVRSKRGRVGRQVFLPGDWIDKPGIEAYKWELHGLDISYARKYFTGASAPRVPLPTLFHTARSLVRDRMDLGP